MSFKLVNKIQIDDKNTLKIFQDINFPNVFYRRSQGLTEVVISDVVIRIEGATKKQSMKLMRQAHNIIKLNPTASLSLLQFTIQSTLNKSLESFNKKND